MEFPVTLEHVDGQVMVTCADIPEFASVGDDEDDALREAVDGIETALMGYMADRRKIPAARKAKRGQRTVRLPALAIAKIGLYQAMGEKGVRKADLGMLMGLHGPQVDRLLNLSHNTKLDEVERALRLIGYRMQCQVEPDPTSPLRYWSM